MELLKLYSEVKATPVEWLWYPYIPSGKITLLQGDPGDGKSTMMMNVISSLTNADFMPNGQKITVPKRVIYQCSEDGVADTIKPRLEKSGADCTRVAFVNEEIASVSFDDETLREAICEFKANLLVVDPFQAYLGDGSDIANVRKIRKTMHRLSIWASTYNCAIVLVGHMTKSVSCNDLYRGLGSIDLVASARSVLQVCKVEGKENLRYIKQVKNTLAPKGADIGYNLDPTSGFAWLKCDENFENIMESRDYSIPTKDEMIAELLVNQLANGDISAMEIQSYFVEQGISIKALKRVKQIAGIKSIRRKGKWYWSLNGNEEE